jgi:hypothetical protein
MSLEHINWRYVGVAGFSSVAAMAAIVSLGNATGYADGTTRTSGTGLAGTWGRQQASGTAQGALLLEHA